MAARASSVRWDGAGDGYYQIRPDGWVNTCSAGGGYWSYNTVTYYSTDGTYLRLDVEHDDESRAWWNNPWTLYYPDGSRVTGGNAPVRLYDRNNNWIEIRSITYNSHPAHQLIDGLDQLTRSLIIEYDTYNPGGPRDYIYRWGVGGTQQLKWTVLWKTIKVNKTYYSTRSGQYPQNLSYELLVVDQIQLPDPANPAQSSTLLKYVCNYNAGTANPSLGWGELNSLKLPSSDASYPVANYTWRWDNYNNLRWNWVLEDHPTRRDLTYQREYDCNPGPPNCPADQVTESWTYTTSSTLGEVKQPDGGLLREHFNSTEVQSWDSGLSYKTERPDGTVVERIWQANTPYGGPVSNPYVKTEFTSVKDSGGALVKTAIKDFNYDKNGNVTQVAEYDWVAYSSVPRDASGKPTGIPASAVLKRVTVNTYYSPTPDASDTTSDDPDVYHKATSPRLKRALESSEVRSDFSPSSALSRSEYFYDSVTTTGNLTQQRSWDSTKGPLQRPLQSAYSVDVLHQYDGVYGNRIQTTDPKGIQTKFFYDANNLYVTRTIEAYNYGSGLWRTTDRAYDFSTGLVTSVTDVENNVTTRTSYDAFGRPVLVEEADGTPAERQTATQYDDVARRIVIRSDLNAVGDGLLVRVEHYDQLGRIRLRRTLENPSDDVTNETLGIKVQTRYYAGSTPSYPNSYQLVSNPYRAATSGGASSEYTMGWTRTKSDQGGRVVEVQTFGGASLPAPWGGST